MKNMIKVSKFAFTQKVAFARVTDISAWLLKVQIIEVRVGNPSWHHVAIISLTVVSGYNLIMKVITTNFRFAYFGNCPAKSDLRNPSLKFVLGKKKDDWNLYHSLPTHTTVAWSGSWLTAIQRSVMPW